MFLCFQRLFEVGAVNLCKADDRGSGVGSTSCSWKVAGSSCSSDFLDCCILGLAVPIDTYEALHWWQDKSGFCWSFWTS